MIKQDERGEKNQIEKLVLQEEGMNVWKAYQFLTSCHCFLFCTVWKGRKIEAKEPFEGEGEVVYTIT